MGHCWQRLPVIGRIDSRQSTGREREREREREGGKERRKEGGRERQTDRQKTETERQRETERDRDRDRDFGASVVSVFCSYPKAICVWERLGAPQVRVNYFVTNGAGLKLRDLHETHAILASLVFYALTSCAV